MSGRAIVVTVGLAAIAVTGALYLMSMQFANGGEYPVYSSLRSDPLGAKLLYDTLALIPGASVSRNYLPMEYLSATNATVLLLNQNGELFDQELLDSVDRLAARGNRVVLTIADPTDAPKNTVPLLKSWKVKFGYDAKAPRDSMLWFADVPGWKAIDQDAGKIFAMERVAGKGSEVLFASSSDFSNWTLAVSDGDADFGLISTAIGGSSRVIFDEEHFGITQSGSVVGLVRRFRLTGMAFGFAICAALLIWRNVSAFPPPAPVHKTSAAVGRTSRSGLLTLLRRHIAASDLATVCWNEWFSTNRRALSTESAARAREIACRETDPVKALREIQPIVNSKGIL
jgi:hypothetical protein